MAAPYSSAQAVIAATGVRPADLKMADEDALVELVDEWLTQFAALIHLHRNRDVRADVEGGFLPAEALDVANSVALEMGSQQVRGTMVTITSPVVKVDDLNVRIADTRLFTADVKARLAVIPARPRFAMFPLDLRPTDEDEDDE